MIIIILFAETSMTFRESFLHNTWELGRMMRMETIINNHRVGSFGRSIALEGGIFV